MGRLFVLLAGLDGVMFMTVLRLFSMTRHCRHCYFGTILNLRFYQVALLTAAFLLITTASGLYNNDASQDFRTFLKRFLLAWQLIFIPSVAAIAFSKAAAGLPFGWFVGILSLAILLFMLALFTLRVVFVWALGLAFMKRRILVLGEGAGASDVVNFIEGAGRSHLQHVHTVSSRGMPADGAHAIGNLLVKAPRQQPQSLPALARSLRADEIVVVAENKQGVPIMELLECKFEGMNVVDAVDFWEREAGQIDFSRAGADWFAFSNGFVLDQRSKVIKRAVDFLASAALLLAALPMLIAVSLLIKLDSPGPIFYRQERVGLNGKVFRVWKFRSMRTDAERDGVPQWAGVGDGRVTRIGRAIRKLRIDEIPQIINVFAGDMSFIGPRPERPFFVEQLREQIPCYDLRHRIRPGITGWAQINYPYGASTEDAKRKLTYDLYYLKNNDLLLDLAILVQTVRVILFAHGAR